MKENETTHVLSVEERLSNQEQALAKIYKSVEQTRKIMLWTSIVSLVFFVIPLIIIAIAFPFIIKTFTSSINGLSAGDASSFIDITANPSLSESLNNLKELGF
ncbi:hypothetical protein KC901_00600 [Patescibacteria group bacterium]|nr:hypothetical protein [Patescibacteria group bacterium]